MEEINKYIANKIDSLINKNLKCCPEAYKNRDKTYKESISLTMSYLLDIMGVDIEMAKDSITDGDKDKKFDAIYFDEEDENPTLYIITTRRKDEAGDTGTFDEDEITTLCHNTEQVLNGVELDNPSDGVKAKINEWRTLISEQPNINVILLTNGIIAEGHKKLKYIKRLQERGVLFKFIDCNSFEKPPRPSKEYTLPILSNSNIVNQKSSIDLIGNLATTNLNDFIKFYEEIGIDDALEPNVRLWLGVKRNSINENIQETLKNNPDLFWFYNNGIVLVVENYKYIQKSDSNETELILLNPYIINGGQTAKSLYSLYQEGDYKDSFKHANILLKIYKTQNSECRLNIAFATNSQNAITKRDLQSNNVHQKEVKEFFRTKGILLDVKVGEDRQHYDYIISNEYILQIYAALYEDVVSKCKDKAHIWRTYFNNVFSDESIKNKNISKKLFRAYEISKYLESKMDDELIKYARYAIIYLMIKFLPRIQNEKIPFFNPNLKTLQYFIDKAYSNALEQIKIVIEMAKKDLKTEKEKEQFEISKLFKSYKIDELLTKLEIDPIVMKKVKN